MATNEFTPTKENNRLSVKILEDEIETLVALSIVVMNRLEDGIEKEGFDITTWKLSQVMNERLSNLTFLDEMRLLLIGDTRRGGGATDGTQAQRNR